MAVRKKEPYWTQKSGKMKLPCDLMDATRNKKFKLGSTTLIILPSPIRTNGTK